ncbi:MAG: cation-transporting P-type ATPase [Flavobacteriales bacterium]|nr:cation-transporting P-type ATPase [Flavobacteriales bacterium]
MAGIEVKIITGDNADTTAAIARLTALGGAEKAMNGDDMMELDDAAFTRRCMTRISSRACSRAEAVRIIKALQTEGHVVAMTGDGVNDGLALKAAHTASPWAHAAVSLAKEAASDPETRRIWARWWTPLPWASIYGNLKKAIQHIISIHIPRSSSRYRCPRSSGGPPEHLHTGTRDLLESIGSSGSGTENA